MWQADGEGPYENQVPDLLPDFNLRGAFLSDADGNSQGDPNAGVAPGFVTTDPGRFQNLTADFSAQINAFKAANAEIVSGVVIPPDVTIFWNRPKQQGFNPKAILFPQSVETLGAAGHNLSSEVWWSPNHPLKSSLTGQSAAGLAADFSAPSNRPRTQPIGFAHSLFEMAANGMGRVSDGADREAVARAIAASDVETIVGRLARNGAGLPPFAAANVCKTPLVGGQWRRLGDGSVDLVIVDNQTAPMIPAAGRIVPPARPPPSALEKMSRRQATRPRPCCRAG